MSNPEPSVDPTYKDLREERLGSYKKVWKIFLWLGWPAAFFTMWLGGRIIGGLHGRITALQDENAQLKVPHETAPQK